MPPLWLIFPELSQGSTAWMTGYGKYYAIEFWKWLNELVPDERIQYQTMFPAPKTWRGFYDEFNERGLDKREFRKYFLHGVQLWNKNDEMQYSKDEITSQQKLDLEFVNFWHNGDDHFNSQWQISDFLVDTHRYFCTEQYMIAEKARVFRDRKRRMKIMETTNLMEMKALGRKVKKFRSKTWDKMKYSVVLNANYYKFSQNKEMRNRLLNINDRVIVEANPTDIIWGIGLAKNDSEASNPKVWLGLNLLGFALMEVRDEIRKVYQNYDKINWDQFEKYR